MSLNRRPHFHINHPKIHPIVNSATPSPAKPSIKIQHAVQTHCPTYSGNQHYRCSDFKYEAPWTCEKDPTNFAHRHPCRHGFPGAGQNEAQ